MELTTKQVELRKLTASEGMYLTQNFETEERTYTEYLYLAENEIVENWREATQEEKENYEKELDEKIKASLMQK